MVTRSQETSAPPEWPTHPDGTPKQMSELTPEQQLAQARWAFRRLKAELESPAVRHFIGGDEPYVEPTVAEYFASKLGSALPDEQPTKLADSIRIDSGCGTSCRQAIDAAVGLQAHVRACFGDRARYVHSKSTQHADAIVRATADVVLCYLYG